jgi:outer membrane receptor protein involved in Fe transport
LVGALVIGWASASWAGTTGKLVGVVKDANTGEPLANANVVVLGTSLGAATTDAGEFFILNVPAGTYDIKATYIGYKELVLSGVRVAPDFTTEVEFLLEPTTLTLGEPVKVEAEKPLIVRDRTGSARFIGIEEIENQPIRGYQAAAGLQSGVVAQPFNLVGEEATNAPKLFIRGGRSNEVAYFVDGFSQQDPLTGISTTAINQNAIDQVVVLTGGFDAEYGRIMSGVVNVVTREGGDSYSGSVELITDNLAGGWIGAKRYDNNIYDVDFGGPVPGIPNMKFFVSGERRWSRDRAPRPVEEQDITELLRGVGLAAETDTVVFKDGMLPSNSLSGWTWQGKLTWDVTPLMKFRLGTLGSVDRWQRYLHSYLLNAEHAPRYEDTNYSIFAKFTHTVNPELFYELGATWFYTERYRGDGVYFKDLYAYGMPEGNPGFPRGLPLFWVGDEQNGEHLFDDYLHRESSYVGLKGDLTYGWRERHTFKTGFEYRRHTLRMYHHLMPRNVVRDSTGAFLPTAFQDADVYGYKIDDPEAYEDSGLNGAKHPVDLALYVQDKYETDDFILRVGLRYDYLNPETPRLRSESKPMGDDGVMGPEDLADSEAYHKLSPRFGVAFPISDKMLFHANYGKFLQQPNLENLYVNYDFLAYKVEETGYYYAFGNPNLKPEETTAYEVGVAYAFSPNATIRLTGFYKNVKNLVEVQAVTAEPAGYATFKNKDYGTIKGVELNVDLRRTRNVAATLAYTLSWAKGTGSTAETQRNIAWTVAEPPKQTAWLDFDQRHKATLNVDFRFDKGEGPVLMGRRLFERCGLNVLVNVGSGFPYTPSTPYDAVTLGNVASQPTGPINSGRGPWTFRVDLKADRTFDFGGRTVRAYIWVLNLFDRKNPLLVYDTSGDPFTTEWLSTPAGATAYSTPEARGLYRLAEHNPNMLDIPRLVRFGLQVGF